MQMDNSPREDDVHQPSNASETRPQEGGEGGTTRFGMEEGDNTDVPATGPATARTTPDPGACRLKGRC